jgi:cell wall-associated NlpC family hydrolase
MKHDAETKARHRAESAPLPPRHRSEDLSDPSNTGPLQLVNQLEHAHVAVQSSGRRIASAVGTGALLLTGISSSALAQPKDSEPATGINKVITDTDLVGMVQASPEAVVPFVKVQVQTTAAPPPPPPPPPPAPPKPVAKAPVFTHKPAPAPVQQAAAVKPAPVAPAPVRQAPAASKGAIIAAAALSQIGAVQDCTRLATRSLAAAGISYHGWPAGYLALGPQVSAAAAVPGDLLYYRNGGGGVPHIAVYIGGGMAVHGGWNGNQTIKFSAYVGSGPVFIRVL